MIELNKIYCGHNVDILREYPDKCIDLTVTSPPYDDLRDYNGYSFNFEGLAEQLYRITKDGGVVVWVVEGRYANGSKTITKHEQAIFFYKLGFNIHDEIFYEKNGPNYPSQNRYYQVTETMFVLSKGEPKTFNPIEDRKNEWANTKWGKSKSNRQSDGSLTMQEWYGKDNYDIKEYGVRFNIWKYKTGAGYSTKDEFAFKHPAIFPEELARDHIISWSNEGDTVLDPMCGSGTTLKMAKEFNRNYIGIDCSSEYCELSKLRVSQIKLDFNKQVTK